MEVKEFVYHHFIGYPVGADLKSDILAIKEMYKNLLFVAQLAIESQQTISVFGRGSSGTIIASYIAGYLIDDFPEKTINIKHIKKQGETSHNDKTNKYDILGLTILVDDFVSTGATMLASIEKVRSDIQNPDFTFDYVLCQGCLQSEVDTFREVNLTKTLIIKDRHY